MRVAFFSGPIEYSVCLANSLCKYCDIDFYYNALVAKRRDHSTLSLLNVQIRRIPINFYRIRDIRNLWSYLDVAKGLRNYDIIHVQSVNIWLGLSRYLFKRVPIIFTVHDPIQHIGLRKMNRIYQDIAQKTILLQSSRFIVHGEKMKKELAQKHNVSFARISVISHGELSFYQKWKSGLKCLLPSRDIKRILFFGVVRKNKGLEYLIRAEPIISKGYENYRICIAGKFEGDFDLYKKLIQDTTKFEIINRYVSNNEVSELFDSSDIVVLPYVSATQSGVLALAFGFGKPVVATDTGSIPEVLEDGRTGLIVPPCDEKALAHAILELLLDKEKCLSFGRNAREVARSKLNWANIAVQTVELYKSVC